MWKYLIPLIMLSATVFSAELEITNLEYLEAHTESDRLRALSESERHLEYQKIVAAAGLIAVRSPTHLFAVLTIATKQSLLLCAVRTGWIT